jgi:signal transduction histidine kinase
MRGSISVSAFSGDSATKVIVEDTGEGIPSDDLPLVFNRFYRGDPSRQTVEGESGLGLSIVKALVEAHGGTITVESEMEFGTTFTISLPDNTH